MCFSANASFLAAGGIGVVGLTGNLWLSVLYVAAPCGALLLSTHQVVRWFGILNLIGLALAQVTASYAFKSAWCFYAALLSTVIYRQFDRGAFDHLFTCSGGLKPNSPSVLRLRAGE